jgi:hypothetical protein
MLKKISVLFLSTISIAVSSCTYANEEDLNGVTQCDTSAVTYSNDIVPILKDKCYRCHDAANVSTSGYQMDTYSFLLDYVNAGSLVDRINDPVNPMPTEGLLDECSRAKIKAWVDAGALDN